MAIRTQITCDVCGAEKLTANHWFRATVQGGVFRSGPYKEGQKPWAEERHVCGAGHADALHHRFVTTGNLAMEKHPEPGTRPVGLTEAGLLGKEPVVEPFVYQEVGGNETEGEIQAEKE